MPRRTKAGPPYTDIPNEVYVVVAFPWGMERNPRSRSKRDYDRVASWAQLVLQQGGLGRLATIECIYSMGTRDEIIIQFEEGTDIIPLLGEHRWANIVRDWKGPPNDSRSTRVFLYNWRDNGDPGNHNWVENFPEPLPLDSIPAKSPYPAPLWTSSPSSLTHFVLPIPEPPNLPPFAEYWDVRSKRPHTTTPSTTVTPSPAPPENDVEPEEEPVTRDSVPTNLFQPYVPPSQHPAHARFLDQEARAEDVPSPHTSPSPPKFIKKLDPYELEEDALSILRAPDPIREDTKYAKHEELEPTLSLSVKLESPEIKVEDESRLVPQVVPTASLGYQPSTELEAYINAHLRDVAAATLSPAPGSSTQATPRSRVTVKREYEEDLRVSLAESKRIKIEDI